MLPRSKWVIGRNLPVGREKGTVLADLGTGGMEEPIIIGRASLSGEGVVLERGPGKVPLERKGNSAPSHWTAMGGW